MVTAVAVVTGSVTAALAAVGVVLLFLALGTALAVALTVRHLRRPLLVGPGVRVPLRWRWSVSRQALMHRRLLVAMGSVHLALGRAGQGPFADLAAEVEDLALGVDRQLVAVDRQPRSLRQRALAPLEPRVNEVEQLAGRLVDTVTDWERSLPGRSADDVRERIEAVRSALAELDSAAGTALGPGPPGGSAPVGGGGGGAAVPPPTASPARPPATGQAPPSG